MQTVAGVGLDQVAQRVVGVDLALDPPGHAEGDELARLELQLLRGAPEELVVLRVRAGPAGFDVVDAEPVELLGDPQLVVDRERDALELRAVAQRRVVDLDPRREGAHSSTCSHQFLYRSVWPRTALAYSAAIAWVFGPGHGIVRSSTEFTALTSAAVPHTNISSQM